MLDVMNLTKSFGAFKALDDLSMHIPEGTVYGLVGPNGAGKSTLIRCLTGVYRPDKGTVLMVSHDFYLVANCADYVLLAEDNTVRRVRGRNFRKMVYDRYFDSGYLEIDRKKQELETGITAAFKKDDLAEVDKLCTELELISGQQ